jgi:hypothetical protein
MKFWRHLTLRIARISGKIALGSNEINHIPVIWECGGSAWKLALPGGNTFARDKLTLRSAALPVCIRLSVV